MTKQGVEVSVACAGMTGTSVPEGSSGPFEGLSSVRRCLIRPTPNLPTPTWWRLTAFSLKQVPSVPQANLKSEIRALLSFRWPLAIWNFFFAPGVHAWRRIR